ncbi:MULTISPECIES: LysR family transcriptional regulator [Burkholderia]|uniref:LysR family transcriptional regulator n=1 Tax=Burkholderia contaminans TaxID=488447 RepID=A0A2S5E606_9BURK|nr:MULTISPECIES: LysR family transcriptional regulator [Burkholderia]EKS9796081.1 LysR family transcriptional regulator [Burkholderia cepacia]EKS9804847.1 LysR family transcriptional regulator [Burkholderia cepacia]EKS9811763.1 LysR family transcriptional regulator [Burkholderia cepacia]EKS9818891.1 LysR family transcriptional regulator [Burkholderia cepacia]EKS9826629.1 LysR family transcriptional regulator [Burkholderia cepacia]
MDRSPNLDQLRAFVAVVEAGSFSGAARRLGRAQSVVSYAVASLEAQLGMPLFERGRRRPQLTAAGEVVLADARRLDMLMGQLQAKTAGLRGGVEAELSLAVDVMFPLPKLVEGMQAFAEAFPTVALNLAIEALGGVMKLVLDGGCALGISGPIPNWPDAIDATSMGAIELLTVAAPVHPLGLRDLPIPLSEAREHTQIVLTDRSKVTDGQSFGIHATRTWKVADLGAKHRLLLAGLGWGSMPMHLIEDDLQSGRLVPVQLADRRTFRYGLSLIRRADRASGPAAQWLIDYLSRQGDPNGRRA